MNKSFASVNYKQCSLTSKQYSYFFRIIKCFKRNHFFFKLFFLSAVFKLFSSNKLTIAYFWVNFALKIFTKFINGLMIKSTCRSIFSLVNNRYSRRTATVKVLVLIPNCLVSKLLLLFYVENWNKKKLLHV